ncbi:MAG: lysophospholipid acyltransferase family protein [Pyrinomonadaceae bacterium]
MRHLRAVFRFVLLFVATFGIYGLWLALTLFIPNKVYWRQLILGLWAASFVRIAKCEIEIIGTPPKAPFFLVANHLGYFDIPVVRTAVKGVFVAKHDIGEWLFLGRMIRNMGTIYVNRGRKRDIPRAGEEVIERLSAGEGVIVFPEGTSSNGESVLPFSSSFLAFAAQTDVPVSYLSISYRTPSGEPPPSDSICWWDDTPFLTHILRLFALRRITAILNFGDEPVTNPDRKQLAAELRDRVAQRFIPMI